MESQLIHSIDIKNTIDRAWGVMQNKHKKKDPETAPPDVNDAKSRLNLQLNPIGQDAQRKRYWVIDGPCAFISRSSPCFLFARIWCGAFLFFFFGPMLSGVSRL